MKKRIVSLLLALVMVLSLVPMSVFAADNHDGQVHVIVENTTYPEAEGAPWEGTLVEEWIDLNEDSTAMSCVVKALEKHGYIQTQYLPFHRSNRKRTQAFSRPSCPGSGYSQGLSSTCF